ncbi:MAG: sensor histidine kinase [Gemmatimonadaceae bacterium]
MASIRTRLTIAYGLALSGTLAAFAVALYVGRRADAYTELGRAANAEAAAVVGAILRVQYGGTPVAEYAPRPEVPPGSPADSIPPGAPPVIRLTKAMSGELERLGGYFLVLDSLERRVYSSYAVRRLAADDQIRLQSQADSLRIGANAAVVPIPSDSGVALRLLLVAAGDPNITPKISRVLAAVPTTHADLAPRLLVSSMVALFPVVLALSLMLAYWIAGNAFRPVERLINDVEAITDGRSLHRRLPADPSNDELSRLTTTLNAMIARLETSFAALRRFTADASHELKTPLAVLRADVERAMHPAHPSERMVALEEALQEIARMTDLVESLLTLARADEGRFDLVRDPVDMEPLVRDVFETASILGEDAGLTVLMPACEPAVVRGDATRLRQLFLNLVTNAIKYTPRGGRVELTLQKRPAAHEVTFAVRDTGIGISAADLPHVFDRFWRADRARSRLAERGGSGLGLAISQWIAQAHGGQLAVQSRLGRGSIFTVTLPLASHPGHDVPSGSGEADRRGATI